MVRSLPCARVQAHCRVDGSSERQRKETSEGTMMSTCCNCLDFSDSLETPANPLWHDPFGKHRRSSAHSQFPRSNCLKAVQQQYNTSKRAAANISGSGLCFPLTNIPTATPVGQLAVQAVTLRTQQQLAVVAQQQNSSTRLNASHSPQTSCTT